MLTGIGKIVAGSSFGFTKAHPSWMVLTCDEQIMRYYQWWVHNSFKDVWGRSIYQLHAPIARCHISIVRGENPEKTKAKVWDQLIGQKVQFEYSNEVNTNGKHWWLPVKCPRLIEIRRELGLPPSKIPLHMTIGTCA